MEIPEASWDWQEKDGQVFKEEMRVVAYKSGTTEWYYEGSVYIMSYPSFAMGRGLKPNVLVVYEQEYEPGVLYIEQVNLNEE